MDYQTICDFLNDWFANCPEGTAVAAVERHHKRDTPAEIYAADLSALGRLAETLHRHGDRHGLYIYLGTRPVGWTETATGWSMPKAGLADDVAAVVGFGLDIDFHPAAGASPPDDVDLAAALATIDAVELEPWCVLHTGGGIQAFWRLDRWVEHADLHDVDSTNAISAHVHDWLVRHCAERGLSPDDTSSIERRFRLPGSENHRHGTPMPVRYLRHSRTTHPLQAFLDAAGPMLPPTRRTADHLLPTAPLDIVVERCGFMNARERLAATDGYHRWARWLHISAWLDGGRERAHQLGSQHPKYSATETNSMMNKVVEKYQHPYSCTKMEKLDDEDICARCTEKHEYWTPVFIGLDHGRHAPQKALVGPHSETRLRRWYDFADTQQYSGKAGTTDRRLVQFLFNRSLVEGSLMYLAHQFIGDRIDLGQHAAGKGMRRLAERGLILRLRSRYPREPSTYLLLVPSAEKRDTQGLPKGGLAGVSRLGEKPSVLAGSREFLFLDLVEAGQEFRIADLAAASGRSPSVYYRLLPSLLALGAIEKVHRGFYRRTTMTDNQVARAVGLFGARKARYKRTFLNNLRPLISSGQNPRKVERQISKGLEKGYLVSTEDAVIDPETGEIFSQSASRP